VFLTRVCENPGFNQIDLSNLLKVDKTTTTKAVQKLIDEGYITRERDHVDKRMWRLFPTSKALSVFPVINDEENRKIDICFDGFTKQEQQLVYGLIKRMSENIEADWKKL